MSTAPELRGALDQPSDGAEFERPRHSRMADWVYVAFAGAAIVFVGLIAFADLEKELVGYLSMALIVALLGMGVHVAVAMLFAGLLGIWTLGGPGVMWATARQAPFNAVDGWELSVIPMFVFMGIALWRFHLTDGLFVAANRWLGRLPGGLAIATNFTGAGFAAASGSTIGISSALGRIAIPEMMRARYKPSLAAGTVAMAGTLGQIIPPSVVLVIYAGVAQVPVGPQLLAGIVPGILLAVSYAVVILVRAHLDPDSAPPPARVEVTWSDRFRSLGAASPCFVIVLLVVGGLLGGTFTPTEAGAVASFATLVLGWLFLGRREGLKTYLSTIALSARDAVAAVAAIFLLLIAIGILTRLMALSGIAASLTEWITGLGLGRVSLLLVLIPVFLVLGMFMDGLTMMLLTVPLLAPVFVTYDINMTWFGIFMVIMIEIGMVTPPVGILGYVVHKVCQDPDVNLGSEISILDVFRGVLPFVLVGLLLVATMVFVPEIVTWLPMEAALRE